MHPRFNYLKQLKLNEKIFIGHVIAAIKGVQVARQEIDLYLLAQFFEFHLLELGTEFCEKEKGQITHTNLLLLFAKMQHAQADQRLTAAAILNYLKKIQDEPDNILDDLFDVDPSNRFDYHDHHSEVGRLSRSRSIAKLNEKDFYVKSSAFESGAASAAVALFIPHLDEKDEKSSADSALPVANKSNKVIKQYERVDFNTIKKSLEMTNQLLGHLGKTQLAIAPSGKIYLAMPAVPGMPLDKFLIRNREMLTYEKTKELLLVIFREVKRLHDMRLVHGDIQEKNMIIAFDDKTNKFSATLVDFEVTGEEGRPTAAGEVPWLAPELGRTGVKTQKNQDIYSLGRLIREKLFVNFGNKFYEEFPNLANMRSVVPAQRPTIEKSISNLLKTPQEAPAEASKASQLLEPFLPKPPVENDRTPLIQPNEKQNMLDLKYLLKLNKNDFTKTLDYIEINYRKTKTLDVYKQHLILMMKLYWSERHKDQRTYFHGGWSWFFGGHSKKEKLEAATAFIESANNKMKYGHNNIYTLFNNNKALQKGTLGTIAKRFMASI